MINSRPSHFVKKSSILMMAVFLLAGCDSPQQKEAHYIEHGNQLFAKGEYDKARLEYKNAIHVMPKDAEPFYRLGLVSEALDDLPNAFVAFSAAVQQNADYHPALLKIAQYYMAAGRYDDARQRLDRVLGQDPKDAEGHALNSALLLREKKLDDAEREAQDSLSLDPANISAYAALTGIYSAQNKPDQAISTVNNGITHNPDNLSLMVLRVLLYEHLADLPKIDESYQAIFKLKPDALNFRQDLASIYVNAGKLDEAEKTLRDGVAAVPDDWDMKHALINFLSEHRSVDMAEKEINDLIHANPKNADLNLWLAELYADHAQMDKASAILEQVIANGKSDEVSLNAHTLLARIEASRGNKDQAKKLTAAVLEKAPDNRAALLMRANLSLDDGNYESAISDLRSILQNAPNDSEALQLLSETFLRQQHLDLAIDTQKKLVEHNPLNYAMRSRLAQMIDQNGDHHQALELITQVTQEAPTYAIGWESAARIAINAQQWLSAQAAIDALDKLPDQHLTAVFLKGQMAERTNRPDDAMVAYKEVITTDPSIPLAQRALPLLVGIYDKAGHLDQAIAFMENLKSDSPYVEALLGKCYTAIGKTDAAADLLDKAIAQKILIQDPYITRAKIYLAQHSPDSAVDVLTKGMQAVPNDPEAPMLLAQLLTETGKYQEAEAIYDSILVRHPNLDAAANNLAELIADYDFNNTASLEKALKSAERFAGSSNPFMLDTLAWVYYRQGNIDVAETVVEHIQKNAAEQNIGLSPQIHYHIGAILMKAGKTDEAKTELQQAVVKNAPYPGSDDAQKILASVSGK